MLNNRVRERYRATFHSVTGKSRYNTGLSVAVVAVSVPVRNYAPGYKPRLYIYTHTSRPDFPNRVRSRKKPPLSDGSCIVVYFRTTFEMINGGRRIFVFDLGIVHVTFGYGRRFVW